MLRSLQTTKSTRIVDWILRLSVAGTFLGHGIFALQVKEGWIPFFVELGFSADFAITVLPLIGVMDVLVAVFVIVRPIRAILLWAVVWGFWTALLRPLTGEPIWDLVERSANFGAPLALIFLYGWPKNVKQWLR